MRFHRVKAEIQYKVVAQDSDYGTEVITWTYLRTVNCEMMDVLPSRHEDVMVNDSVVVASNRTRIRMRYRTDIDTSMRLITRRGDVQRIYTLIAGPAEIGDRRYMEFIAEWTTAHAT